jgi:hypothetical protein
MTRWRQRLGEEQFAALIQESLSVAHQTGALVTEDLERVAVDAAVQPKNVTFPTHVKLTHKAIVMLGRLAKRRAVRIRGHFPNDEAESKLLYLVLSHAAEAWKRPPREWFEAKTQFAVVFAERFVNV